MSAYLFTGGPIISVDKTNPTPEAVVIENGKILFAGPLSEARSRMPSALERVDLAGSSLLPGFIDAHSHPLWAAKTRGAPVVDVRAETVPTFDALLAKIERRVAAAKSGEFLLFFGLDAQLHEGFDTPTRQFLDDIAPDNPLGIQTSNCHALFMNSAGFAACGIDENTPTPTGSVIDRDDTGRPTGKIAEAITWQALETFYEAWGEDRLNDEFEAGINDFIRQGITTTTEHLYLPFYKAYYLNALGKGWPLPRIAAYQQAVSADLNVERMNVGEDRLWMAGVKIHADGSPFIGNIWLSQPYLDNDITRLRMGLAPGHTGGMNYPPEYFENMVRTYVSQGWQMTIHTQGDRTIDTVLDLLENVLSETPRPDHRFRLEHCALMREDQIERAVKLGVLSSFFINHITHWGAPIEDALFGPERAAHYMPAGSAVKHGMRISLHADTPMTDPSALELMQAATTRTAGDGRCVGAGERLDAQTALKAVTIDAAFQICKEDMLGSISPGKHADLVVLEKNPLETQSEDLASIKVEQTWLAGERVWAHDG
ncbi:amidohydrolase [Hoeflea prorocentri]|uniref:Amidohydrolase n=1 Tax=Hoeflea prorocentri TaxID=1922333 RepID=A0A9X3UJX5_9HYPH|nr:amidohydrolase [Hoeflea prorocentri]MCY6382165.1 amidohydrolase [Hoeflea prorocentri]MDA5399965.1 amidohydrolase [Hoeflea prorocentri]